MKRKLVLGLLAVSPGMALAESDFFAEMPVVLTVSRLAQPLDETPGAVTVIDRETIRRSGARELAELLRLVPGFVVSHFDGGARPFVNYHGDYDAFARRIQVYVDGRSVYSGLAIGSSLYGMMGVVLDDIERIEVLRGSNSAAYGANAFLGVINVVTRHAEDVRGGRVAVNAGGQGVRDATARIGWGGEGGSYRLTLATRRDDGFDRSYDDKRVDQAHFRADFQPTRVDELMLAAGLARFGWGMRGEPGILPDHTQVWRNAYAQLQWRHGLEQDGEIRVEAVADREEYDNFWPALRADGVATRFNLNALHAFRPDACWRVVWGGEVRHEAIESPYMFVSEREQDSLLVRLFGNLEWRPGADWLVNAGGLWERYDLTGAHFAPRLMVNYHLSPNHTLRIGSSRAYKVPSQLEVKGDWWYLGFPQVVATGQVEPERIDAHEIGYLGNFPAAGVNVDLRLFRERVASVVRFAAADPGNPLQRFDLVNKDASTQTGWEVQLRWRPRPGTEVQVNHAEMRLDPDADSTSQEDRGRAPGHVSSLALFQRLPGDFDLGLIYYRVGALFWRSPSQGVPAYDQLDLRLGRSFRLDGRRAEAAIVAQALDGDHPEFSPDYRLDRRVFASLSLEF